MTQYITDSNAAPIGAKTGDSWVDRAGSFKRVLSRGGAWENTTPGGTHPDEILENDDGGQTDEKQRELQVSPGAGPGSQGDGNNGTSTGDPIEPTGGRGQVTEEVDLAPQVTDGGPNPFYVPEDSNQVKLTEPPGVHLDDPEPTARQPDRDEGLDGNGSPVV